MQLCRDFGQSMIIAQRIIWAQPANPNLDRILLLLLCVSTVRLLKSSSVAISRFILPCPISIATSRSRLVRGTVSYSAAGDWIVDAGPNRKKLNGVNSAMGGGKFNTLESAINFD